MRFSVVSWHINYPYILILTNMRTFICWKVGAKYLFTKLHFIIKLGRAKIKVAPNRWFLSIHFLQKVVFNPKGAC